MVSSDRRERPSNHEGPGSQPSQPADPAHPSRPPTPAIPAPCAEQTGRFHASESPAPPRGRILRACEPSTPPRRPRPSRRNTCCGPSPGRQRLMTRPRCGSERKPCSQPSPQALRLGYAPCLPPLSHATAAPRSHPASRTHREARPCADDHRSGHAPHHDADGSQAPPDHKTLPHPLTRRRKWARYKPHPEANRVSRLR